MRTDEPAHESKEGAADEEETTPPAEQKLEEGEAANGEALDSEKPPTGGNRPGEGGAPTLPAAEPKSEGDTHSEN